MDATHDVGDGFPSEAVRDCGDGCADSGEALLRGEDLGCLDAELMAADMATEGEGARGAYCIGLLLRSTEGV